MYDVTDEVSFNNIRNWMKNIQVNAQSNVNKVGLGGWRWGASGRGIVGVEEMGWVVWWGREVRLIAMEQSSAKHSKAQHSTV